MCHALRKNVYFTFTLSFSATFIEKFRTNPGCLSWHQPADISTPTNGMLTAVLTDFKFNWI